MMRNLLALLVLVGAGVVMSACSVFPTGDGSTDTASNPRDDEGFVSAESDEGTDAPDSYAREGKGAPGNTVDNAGGERVSTAGGSDAIRNAELPAKGANVDADDKESREAFDSNRRRAVEYRWLLDRATTARQEQRFEDAENYLERAIALYPDDPKEEATSMLDEVRVSLSKPAKVAPRWGDIPEAAQQEFELEAERAYKSATEAERSGNWEEAIREWERLERLVKFAPYGAELKNKYDTPARAGLHRARIELQKSRKELEDEALRRERRMRDLAAQAEEERRKEEIVELWRQAIFNVELRRFKTAEEIVDRILYLDPQFSKAEGLKRDIQDRKLLELDRMSFENRIAGYQEALRQMREDRVPQTEIIRYPTGLLAERIRARRQRQNDAIRMDPKLQQIQNILSSKTIDFPYEGWTLQDAIKDIRRRANINLDLSKDVRESVGEDEIGTSLDGELPVGAGLNIILGDFDLRTDFRNGVLFVVSEDATPDPSTLVTSVHDVRDLVFNIAEFAGPRLRLKGADNDDGPPITYPDEEGRTFEDAEAIVDMVTEALGDDNWDEPFSMMAFGKGYLVVTHTSQMQAELRGFLDELREVAGLMVNMEVRFISVEDDYLSDFGIDFRGNGGPAAVPNQADTSLEDVTSGAEDFAGGAFDNNAGGIATANPTSGIFFNSQDPNDPPVNFNQDIRGRFEHIFDNSLGNVLTSTGGFSMQFAFFENLTQINAVIHAVQKRKKARILTAPRLSAFNTQRANITIVNQIPYVRDFSLDTATTAAIANPVMDTILDGMVLDVKPTISNDRRFITVEVQPTVAELTLPIPTFTTTLGPTSAVTIQIPEIQLQTVQTTVRVPDGGAVVIAGLKTVRETWFESGVPILSDIPLLGVLFRRQGRNKEQFNLVIVLHARVIDLNDEELHRPGWGDSSK